MHAPSVPVGASRWDRLPEELRDLVLEHRAALTLQAGWTRRSLWAHARSDDWAPVATRLCALGVWRRLVPYDAVRREWRTEPHSWCAISPSTAGAILDEAVHGLWGSRRLYDRVCDSDAMRATYSTGSPSTVDAT